MGVVEEYAMIIFMPDGPLALWEAAVIGIPLVVGLLAMAGIAYDAIAARVRRKRTDKRWNITRR